MKPLPLPKRAADGSYTFTGGLMIDADGCPRAYGPKGTRPLDLLANAGQPGNWWGLVTDTGKPDGEPVIQTSVQPFPGYYVSATTYERRGFSRTDPDRYLDSERVKFIVVPSHWRKEARGVVLGCKALVRDLRTGNSTFAVVGDLGPRHKAGEGSIALAQYFGVPWSPRTGGTAKRRFVYTFWPDIEMDGFTLQPM